MKKQWSSMTLFRKLLLSFFSKKAMTQAGFNPAAMFVSFVSAKQFFGLINRRIVEHYKLNLFDIAIDPFEAKIGLWENPSINVKNLDFYYGYTSAAHFIGYKFYSPNNIATAMSILSALCSHEEIAETSPQHFKNFIFTVYIFIFTIIAKVKICPEGDLKTQYDWTMKTFWSLYVVVCKKTKTRLNQKTLLTIQKKIMNETRWTFCLHYCSQYCSKYFSFDTKDTVAYYEWLLSDEIDDKNRSIIISYFLKNHSENSHNTDFTEYEQSVIDIIIPADLTIRYIFWDKEWPVITRYVLSNLYDKEQLNKLLDSFLTSGKRIQELLDFFINPSQIKKNFFFGIQQYMWYVIKHHFDKVEEQETDLSVFSSLIDDDDEYEKQEIEGTIKAIKIETGILDRLINFYVSYIGGMQIARGDSGYIRLHKSGFLTEIAKHIERQENKPSSLLYQAKNLVLYSKNLFYYSYAYDNIRAGKENFAIPLHTPIKIQADNPFVNKAMSHTMLSILLQDFNLSTVKLFVKKWELLSLFKDTFLKRISQILQHDKEILIHSIYQSYSELISANSQVFSNLLLPHLNSNDIATIKDRLYTFDFWLGQDCAAYILSSHTTQKIYDPLSILGIIATLRETFLWLLIYYTYIKSMEESHQKQYYPDSLITIYCRDILALDEGLIPEYSSWIIETYNRYSEILSFWTHLDDNHDYCYIWLNNRIGWIAEKNTFVQYNSIPDEDIIRLLWYLKTISYYNKRYLIPEI